MKTNCFLLAVGILFAMAFIFGCSSDDDSKPDSSGSCNIQDYRTVTIGNQIWMAENFNCDVEGSKCYDNLKSNCDKYGRLYDWSTSLTVCPSGWRLPGDADWEELMDAVGGEATAGARLKTTSGWNNSNGTDDYGFSGKPGGHGDQDGIFSTMGFHGQWWSLDVYEHDDIHAYGFILHYAGDNAFTTITKKTNLYSVRCVQEM